MAYINFIIPGNKEDLLKTSVRDEYSVKNVLVQRELSQELKNAKSLLQEEGAEYILSNFDVYYSVLHHGDSVTMDVAFKAYEDLHKGVIELNKALGFILEDKESLNDETKQKYVNILKMLLYIYIRISLLIEQRNSLKNDQPFRGRKKSSKCTDEDFVVDKKNIMLILNNIMQREISFLWDNEIVEESFINLVSGICYDFLQNPSIKKEKEEFTEIFNVLGYLIKSYNHGTTFVIRITQLVKIHEHMSQTLPKGIQQLVQTFNYKGLLHELVEELTEWQTQADDKHQDNQGARHCAAVLSALAALMPDLMMPEVVSLNSYLYYDPPSLRISVIMVMVEVILNNLTSHELNEEQRNFRDELIGILMEHIEDNSVFVRAKIFQQWARMQKESAIPLKFQQEVFAKISEHLYDKGALARKSAANCITTFLSCNAFSSNLSLSAMKKELEGKKKLLADAKEQLKDPKMDRLMELQSQWDSIVEKLKSVVQEELESEDGRENDSNKENKLPIDQVPDVIRMYIQADSFKEAFQVCREAIKDSKFLNKYKEECESPEELDLYMTILYTIFFDVTKVVEEIQNQQFVQVTQDDLVKLDSLSKHVDFLEHCVSFLQVMDKSLDSMKELLETTSMSDMNEAIEFFIAAYHFNIDRASDGIMAMLKSMQRNEQERKDAVVDAFKKIYLTSDASNMADHCTTIVRRLIKLVKSVPANNIDDLCEIISDWCSKGIMDNAVIDMLWQYVTGRVPVSEADEIASVELLRMAALGRKTIISRNISLVTNIGFGERGRKNMVLLGACCSLLSVAFERVDINGKNPPFKIKADDQCFNDLVNVLTESFFKPVEFYNRALYGGIDFVYKLCTKPEEVCESIINGIVPKLAKKQKEEPDSSIPDYAIIRLCQLGGYIALKHLEYMDDTTYKELKRRQTIRDERKKGKKEDTKGAKKKKGGGRKSIAATTASEASLLNSAVAEDSILEGAQAEDMDAEFILNVLENDIVTGSGSLAKLTHIMVKVCERPDIFKTQELQFAATTALMRYMLVSSKFCQKHIRLIFTIFEKTPFPDIKTNILIHVSDLLTRFPNIIEPWTPRIFQSLKDPLPQTRKATFFTLSSLILRDMIRAHSHIPEMASCLTDEEEEMQAMCKTFFVKLSHKENNLYNALPDIFTHVMEQESVDDEGVKSTMKLLFDLTDNVKHMENVVARFCGKFKLTEDNRQHKNIAYCLTLVKYNDKALKKLIDEFPTYKHLVHDEDIYGSFKTIMQICNKPQIGKADLKPLVTELDKLIKSVFELNENGLMPPPPPPKSTKKRSRPNKKSSRRKRTIDDSDDSD